MGVETEIDGVPHAERLDIGELLLDRSTGWLRSSKRCQRARYMTVE
jgi:hypothetical protein